MSFSEHIGDCFFFLVFASQATQDGFGHVIAEACYGSTVHSLAALQKAKISFTNSKHQKVIET